MSTGALLDVLGVAPLLEGLPGHVLLDVLALLPSGGAALPPGDVRAVLLVLILGDGGWDAAADLIRDVVADFTRSMYIIADLLGDLVALSAGDGGAPTLGDLLGLDPGHQGANTPGLLLAVLNGDLLAGLAVQLLAVNLGHLDTPQFGDIGALLARELAALTLGDLLAVSPGDVLALFLLDSVALPLVDLLAVLPGNLTALLLGLLGALLGCDVTAHLLIVDLLADLAGHGGADLGVDSVALPLVSRGALLTGNVPALLLGNQRTLPIIHNAALLGWNILAHLVLYGLALPLIDDLTLGLGAGGALLLHDGRALLLVPGVALLVELGGALLLVDGLLDSPGDADALHLGDVVTFFLILLLASLLNVISSLTVLAVLEAALLTGDGLLHRPLGDLALALLDISADGVGYVMALPSGDGVVDGLGHLLTDLLRDLAADGRSITLE